MKLTFRFYLAVGGCLLVSCGGCHNRPQPVSGKKSEPIPRPTDDTMVLRPVIPSHDQLAYVRDHDHNKKDPILPITFQPLGVTKNDPNTEIAMAQVNAMREVTKKYWGYKYHMPFHIKYDRSWKPVGENRKPLLFHVTFATPFPDKEDTEQPSEPAVNKVDILVIRRRSGWHYLWQPIEIHNSNAT